MKIYLCTPFENHLAKRGTRFIDIAEILHAAQYEVVYVTTDFSHAYKRKYTQAEMDDDVSSVPYMLVYLDIPGYSKNISVQRVVNNYIMSKRYYKYLKSVIKEGDIVMIPSRPVDFIYYISKLKKFGVKLIMDIRDIWPDCFSNQNKIFEVYCNHYLNSSVAQFDSFLHISPRFTEWLNRYKRGATSEFVPPGFNGKRWKCCKPKKIKPGDIVKVIFVGALQYQLDILPFIKAIEGNNRFELGILGEEGAGQRYKEVSEYIDEHEIRNVHWLGIVEPDKVPDVIKNYDIGIIPMITNSLINKFFDYLGAYLPIMVLGNNDMADMVLHHDIGWVAGFNCDEIKMVIDQIDDIAINEKIENVKMIRDKFNRDTLYKRILLSVDTLVCLTENKR